MFDLGYTNYGAYIGRLLFIDNKIHAIADKSMLEISLVSGQLCKHVSTFLKLHSAAAASSRAIITWFLCHSPVIIDWFLNSNKLLAGKLFDAVREDAK